MPVTGKRMCSLLSCLHYALPALCCSTANVVHITMCSELVNHVCKADYDWGRQCKTYSVEYDEPDTRKRWLDILSNKVRDVMLYATSCMCLCNSVQLPLFIHRRHLLQLCGRLWRHPSHCCWWWIPCALRWLHLSTTQPHRQTWAERLMPRKAGCFCFVCSCLLCSPYRCQVLPVQDV